MKEYAASQLILNAIAELGRPHSEEVYIRVKSKMKLSRYVRTVNSLLKDGTLKWGDTLNREILVLT